MEWNFLTQKCQHLKRDLWFIYRLYMEPATEGCDNGYEKGIQKIVANLK